MSRLNTLISLPILSIVCIGLGACQGEPIPDHLGLFAVSGGEIYELPDVAPPSVPYQGAATSSVEMTGLGQLDLEGFSTLFPESTALSYVPEYFVLYDTAFNPGDLHLYRLESPRWQRGKLALDVEQAHLNIEPIADSPGMYRLRPGAPLSERGHYVILGGGESATGSSGYLKPVCPRCDLASTKAAIIKVRDDEAARIREATTPTKTVFNTRVRVAPHGAFAYCTTCFWHIKVTDVDITWSRNPTAGVDRARFADIHDVAWDTRWRCLKIPPLRNSACVLQTADSDQATLHGVANAGSKALNEWRQKYPNGLPYAEGPTGP